MKVAVKAGVKVKGFKVAAVGVGEDGIAVAVDVVVKKVVGATVWALKGSVSKKVKTETKNTRDWVNQLFI